MVIDGELRKLRLANSPPVLTSSTRATKLSRFEFLARLAALDEGCRLYWLDDVAIAISGFTGTHGWAFVRVPGDEQAQGTVRLTPRLSAMQKARRPPWRSTAASSPILCATGRRESPKPSGQDRPAPLEPGADDDLLAPRDPSRAAASMR